MSRAALEVFTAIRRDGTQQAVFRWLRNGYVVVAKVAMDALEATWKGMAGERVFVTDRHGIAFITNVPDWRFRTMRPLSAESRCAEYSRPLISDTPRRARCGWWWESCATVEATATPDSYQVSVVSSPTSSSSTVT